MDREEIRKVIHNELKRTLPETGGKFDDNDLIFDTEKYDSLEVLELMARLEILLDIQLSGAQLFQARRIGDIVRIVEEETDPGN